jgi:choline-sulfatase
MQRPNFVVIMSDQHSPHVLGCAGDGVVRTPNLDRLAARGVRFSSAYCAFPLCVPSRTVFMTGQPPGATTVWSNGCVLPSDTPTFAHALGAAGYETVLCGRMHFNGPDQHHGFERRLVGDLSRGYAGAPSTNLGHIPSVTTSQVAEAVEISGAGHTAYEGFDAVVTAAAVDFLRQRARPLPGRGTGPAPPRPGRAASDAAGETEAGAAAAARGGRPFCLVVGLVLPHNPYICAPDLLASYLPHVGVPPVPDGYLDGLHPAMRRWREQRGVGRLAPAAVRRARAAYYGLTTVLDQNVGRILDALAAAGLAEETVVVYTSDHGDMAGELGMWWKSSMYEGSVGVPLIWSWPGRRATGDGGRDGFPPGRTVRALASLIDVAPTLADLAGAPALPHATGRSLAPWLRGEAPAGRPAASDEVFAEMNPAMGVPALRMIRRGPWKLVHFDGFDAPQLFNLDDDPQELHDRGSDPALAGPRADLRARALDGWSAAVMEATLARRARDRGVLTAWYRAVRPPDPALWTADPAENVIPA